MKITRRIAILASAVALVSVLSVTSFALARPGVEFKIFQFPADKIPRIDGDPSDWAMVPESYSIGMDQLKETVKGRGFNYDKKDLDVKVKVGWVKGLNRLYFLYEAYDNFWDFDDHSRHNDIFELVVDGDLSGGPLITVLHPNSKLIGDDAFFQLHGVHAQNYHIFTPADGPERAVVSKLVENKLIGMSWAVLDYDGPEEKDYKGFWNLSHTEHMYGNADELVAFRLMPLEAKFQKPIDAHWSFKILDMNRRLLAFQDESNGKITSWRWDFGDGTSSTEQHPIHQYQKAGEYTVNLYIEGPGGKSRWTKVRNVAVR